MTSEDESPGFIIPQKIFAYAPKTELTDFKPIEERKGPYDLFIREVCTIAGNINNDKIGILTLAELIST